MDKRKQRDRPQTESLKSAQTKAFEHAVDDIIEKVVQMSGPKNKIGSIAKRFFVPLKREIIDYIMDNKSDLSSLSGSNVEDVVSQKVFATLEVMQAANKLRLGNFNTYAWVDEIKDVFDRRNKGDIEITGDISMSNVNDLFAIIEEEMETEKNDSFQGIDEIVEIDTTNKDRVLLYFEKMFKVINEVLAYYNFRFKNDKSTFEQHLVNKLQTLWDEQVLDGYHEVFNFYAKHQTMAQRYKDGKTLFLDRFKRSPFSDAPKGKPLSIKVCAAITTSIGDFLEDIITPPEVDKKTEFLLKFDQHKHRFIQSLIYDSNEKYLEKEHDFRECLTNFGFNRTQSGEFWDMYRNEVRHQLSMDDLLHDIFADLVQKKTRFDQSEKTAKQIAAYRESIVDTIADKLLDETDEKIIKWPEKYYDIVNEATKEFIVSRSADLLEEQEKIIYLVQDSYTNPVKRMARDHAAMKALKNRKKTPEQIEHDEAFNIQLQRVAPNYAREKDQQTLTLAAEPFAVQPRKRIDYLPKIN
jgi:hypothetical protein